MNGATVTGTGSIGNPGPSWHLKGTGNFFGNGLSDLVWQNDDGSVAIWEMNGTNAIGGGVVAANPGPSWHVMGSGNYTGVGQNDILFQNSNGAVGDWEMSGTSIIGGGNIANRGPTWHVGPPVLPQLRTVEP